VARSPRSTPQRYFTIFSEVRDFPLSTGIRQWSMKVSQGGVIPKQIIIAFVETAAFVGSQKLNPFNFQNFGRSRFNLKVNGQRVPEDPLRPDFTSFGQGLSQAYTHLHMSSGKFRTRSGNCINKDLFKDGLCIFPFDLTADQCNGFHVHAGREGTVELELEWKAALSKGIIVLAHCISHQIIQLKGEDFTPIISTF